MLVLLPNLVTAADAKGTSADPKVVSGMSIIGNDETPKSLYLVPWKDSGEGGDFNPGNLKDELKPIDKKEFLRVLDFSRKINPDQQ